jgi:hypothetical protein
MPTVVFDGDKVSEEFLETALKADPTLPTLIGYNTETMEPQVYPGSAPQSGMAPVDPMTGYPPPHIVYYNQSAGSETLQAMGEDVTWYDGLWTVLVVGPEGDIDRVDNSKGLIYSILQDMEGSTATGYVTLCNLERSVWLPPQEVDGVPWVRRGYTFRIYAQPPLPV